MRSCLLVFLCAISTSSLSYADAAAVKQAIQDNVPLQQVIESELAKGEKITDVIESITSAAPTLAYQAIVIAITLQPDAKDALLKVADKLGLDANILKTMLANNTNTKSPTNTTSSNTVLFGSAGGIANPMQFIPVRNNAGGGSGGGVIIIGDDTCSGIKNPVTGVSSCVASPN
ncbi:hypothetical protein [Agitococcus lubricus]|uniref:Uncharacterized protein n=1 Tax=Agitococcus lubricus TaxID=1077255 RepID=A0A2T5IW58_9GAMM|nr:hypothetical protein [Agitococcus lubricus]PTQ88147.1 hypothetical protein C8N29_1145 [Agitococcus lubricus]